MFTKVEYHQSYITESSQVKYDMNIAHPFPVFYKQKWNSMGYFLLPYIHSSPFEPDLSICTNLKLTVMDHHKEIPYKY